MKECIICKKQFENISNNQKCCSKKCSVLRYRNYQRKYNKTKVFQDSQHKYHQTENFKNYQKKYRQTNKRKKYEKEYKQTDKYKQYQKEYANKRKKPIFNKRCLVCNESFLSRRIKQKYCSKKCSDIIKNQKIKAYSQREDVKEYKRRYVKEYDKTLKGKESRLKRRLNRRAAENNIIECFSMSEWKDKCEATNGICQNCKTPFDNNKHQLSIDHFFPVSQANKDFQVTGIKRIYTIDDVGPLCKSCNSIKFRKIINQNI